MNSTTANNALRALIDREYMNYDDTRPRNRRVSHLPPERQLFDVPRSEVLVVFLAGVFHHFPIRPEVNIRLFFHGFVKAFESSLLHKA